MEKDIEYVIPTGDTHEDAAARRKVILDFNANWKKDNPTQRRYNLSLKDYINIRYISINETTAHAAKSYYSTLAVLQLDSILTYAKRKKMLPTKKNTANQKQFEHMIIMEHVLPGIGHVKMTVGIKRTTLEKVQYCITAIDTEEKHLL